MAAQKAAAAAAAFVVLLARGELALIKLTRVEPALVELALEALVLFAPVLLVLRALVRVGVAGVTVRVSHSTARRAAEPGMGMGMGMRIWIGLQRAGGRRAVGSGEA